jgi:NTE family protein
MGRAGHDVTRALVLGGGGVAGAAWETGILLGLQDAGIDLRSADRFIGTSAGSRVAADLTNGVPLAESFARMVAPPPTYEISVDFDVEKLMAAFADALATTKPGVELSRALGRYALEADTAPEQVRRDIIAGRLAVHTWPDGDLRIVAIDASTGQTRVFTAADGVSLVDAVAASCAVPGIWPPVTIDGARYIDGGMRSSANPDLAAGCEDVVVIAPVPEMPMAGPDVTKAVKALKRTARLVTIGPDAASTAAIGNNPLAPATARPSAEAGRAQAAAHVDEVAAVWGTSG